MKQKVIKTPLMASENKQLWLVNCVIDEDSLTANLAYVGSFLGQVETVQGGGRTFNLVLPSDYLNLTTYLRAINATFEILE